MIYYAGTFFAITVLILHFAGWLRRNNLEWLVLVAAIAIFPAVLWGR